MLVTERTILGIASFSIALTGLFLSNMFLVMMIGEINRKRSETDQVSYFGFTLPKVLRIFSEYRRVYPGGKLHSYAFISFGIAMLGLISVAVCFYKYS